LVWRGSFYHLNLKVGPMIPRSVRCLYCRDRKKGTEPFLADLTVPAVRDLLEIALPLPPRSVALRLAWSDWRRAKRRQAQRSHYRRRALGLGMAFTTNIRSP
jgi:hypothetical protein